MNKYYVYRITNKLVGKHYYGIKSIPCEIPPEEVIGVTYFSSSTDKDFMDDQKNNPQNYRYKIIFCLETLKEAAAREARLHNKFRVWENKCFYNKAAATERGFYWPYGSLGNVRTKESKDLMSSIMRQKYLDGSLDHLKDYHYKEGDYLSPNFLKRRGKAISNYYKNGGVPYWKGKRLSEETKKKISMKVKKAYKDGRLRSDGEHNPMVKYYDKIVTKEYREKMSLACSGEKNGFYGREHTAETKRALSMANDVFLYTTPDGVFRYYQLKDKYPQYYKQIARWCSRSKKSKVRKSTFNAAMMLFYNEYSEIENKTFCQLGFTRRELNDGS